MLIDCHIHPPRVNIPGVRAIDEATFQEEVRQAREVGVGLWIMPGVTVEDSRAVVERVDGEEDFFACIGVHPNQIDQYREDSFQQLGDLARSSSKVVGIGEVGIDYETTRQDPETQRRAFREQIGLARELKLPLNLHTYGKASAMDLIDILHQERAYEVGGVLHNYMGNEDMARRLADMGFYVSVSVVLFHPEADRLRGVYRAVPLGNLVMDTDWPSGLLYRTGPGEYPFELDVRTHLSHLRRYADRLAEEKDMDVEQVENVITMNTLRAFPRVAEALS